jgi:arsenite methyltransferase
MKHIVPILKEMLSKPKLQRVPEHMVMDLETQTQDFFNYGLGDTALRAAYLFHAKWASRTFAKCKRVLDLGTGPANQISILAQMNPSIEFVGVDLSDKMLELAKQNCAKLRLKNVTFVQDDMTQLNKLEDGQFDGVFSSVALHHLPNASDVEKTFKSARRVLTEVYSVYITDFLLVKNEQSIQYLLSLNETQPAIFKQDYEASLRASFPKIDFQNAAAKYLDEADLYTSFGAQFLMILKTRSYELDILAQRFLDSEIEKLSRNTKSIYKSTAALMAFHGMF